MTSFLPPLSTATPPQNEIICPELRISGAYLPKIQKSRGSAGFFWATPETKSAQFFRQKLDNFCRGLPGWVRSRPTLEALGGPGFRVAPRPSA